MAVSQYQYNLSLIQHEANGSIVQQRAGDGYINATALCKAAGKNMADYGRLQSTKEFFSELEADMGIPISELIQVVKGGFPENQGTWIHPDAAVHFGQWLSPKFAVKVSRWVRDWMTGKLKPQEPTPLPDHLLRYIANDNRISPGHFSILQETALSLFGPLYNIGFIIPKNWVPDISVGRAFCKWLREVKGFDTDSLPKYWHDYLDGRRPVEVNQYPDELLADFRTWFRVNWLPVNGAKYFKGKDPDSLVFLEKLPALAGPKKKKVIH